MDVPFPLISQVATTRKHPVVGLYAINKLNPKITYKKKKMNLGHAPNSTCQKRTTTIRFYWSPDLSPPHLPAPALPTWQPEGYFSPPNQTRARLCPNPPTAPPFSIKAKVPSWDNLPFPRAYLHSFLVIRPPEFKL